MEETPEITLKLETKYIESKSTPLDLKRKYFIKRIPRKAKKTLKKEKGKEGFISWLNEQLKYSIGEPVICYSPECAKELFLEVEKTFPFVLKEGEIRKQINKL